MIFWAYLKLSEMCSPLLQQYWKLYMVSQKKDSYKIFGFGLFVVFWTPLDTDLDTLGLFGSF